MLRGYSQGFSTFLFLFLFFCQSELLKLSITHWLKHSNSHVIINESTNQLTLNLPVNGTMNICKKATEYLIMLHLLPNVTI